MKIFIQLFPFIFFALSFTPIGKSQKWTSNANANGSDYRVLISYDSDVVCSCSRKYAVTAYKNSTSSGNKLGTNSGNTSKDASSFYVVVGPNTNNSYITTLTATGKNNAIFNCWVDCSSTGKITLPKHPGRKTSAIKNVNNLTASWQLDHIDLTWTKGTNIPNGSTGYKIAKGEPSNIIATLNGSARSYKDILVGPGEQHKYYIYTFTNSWGGHTSSGSIRTGYTRERSARATDNLSKKVTVTWDDLVGATDEVIIKRNGEQIGTVNINSSNDTSYTDSDLGLIPGFEYEYAITWVKGTEEYNISTSGASLANGRISGHIRTPLTQLPIANALVCATLENDIPQMNAGVKYCDTTNANGQYTIRKIYYHQEASFTVEPYKVNHGFDPGSFDGQILELEFPNLNLDFQDTTAFVISGRITQELNGSACGVSEAEIWIDGLFKGVKTDELGYYFLSVEESGTYNVSPKLLDHEFVPAGYNILIDRDTAGFDYFDMATNLLSGYVKGGCDINIGQSTLRVYSTDDQVCIDTTILTDEDGNYALQLPARNYAVEVIAINIDPSLSIDPEAVIEYFTTEMADLLTDSVKLNFIYRQPPEIMVSGLPDPTCSGLESSIVRQEDIIYLEIEVRESFGDQSCPVNEGYIVIKDEVGDRQNISDTIILEGGIAEYYLNPGEPNLVAPHQKNLQITAFVDDEITNWSKSLVVTGIRPREQTFATVMPEIPFMVLHDPPGDASYSFFEENQIAETSMRFFAKSDSSLDISAEIKLGTRFETGAGFSTETVVWGSIGGGVEMGKRQVTDDEWIVRTHSKEYFSTSNQESITGEEGDVFLGAAMNLIYALTDVLSVDENACELVLSTSMIMGNDGFNTTFIYTEDHIKNSLIPQLSQIRDLYQANASDSAQLYENQISVWEQVLENNRKNKRASSLIENRSFSAGTNYLSSSTSDSTGVSFIEMSTFLDVGVAVGGGFEVAGSGLSGKVEVKMKMETGSSTKTTNTKSTTTGFVLNDDDPGDFFSVNIKEDLVYGTPVFELVSGRSSCPWEAGTQPREGVQVQATPFRIDNVPSDGSAVFDLGIGNVSQSEETRTYLLRFLQESNPDGAEVTIGGSQVQNAIPYTIGPFAERGATVTIKKGPTAFDYPNLQFVVGSGCEDNSISDTIGLTTSFQHSFPPIELIKPITNWTLNAENENNFFIRFNGYDKSQLNKIQLQYAPKGSSAWHIGAEWLPDELSESTQGHMDPWLVDEIKDGLFDIRLRADYAEGSIYSEIVDGVIDRKSPEIFGLPEPTDAFLNPGDRIAIRMDEPIDCFSFSSQNVSFSSLTTGISYPVEAGCSDDLVIIKPLWNAKSHEGEIISVIIDMIIDLNGNSISDSIKWQFSIQNEGGNIVLDTDEDGISDDMDNCSLAFNPQQEDLDGDKIGDACDEDLDGDGINNNEDNCVFTMNPNQMDADSNGIGDECEPFADSDGDSVNNIEDNCPSNKNIDQSDLDGDGKGDVCDEDVDGDGVLNHLDNCATNANPDQADTNGDGVGDACDPSTSITEFELNQASLNLAPNPANSNVEIQLNVISESVYELNVLDNSGKSIWTNNPNIYPSGVHELNVNLTDIAPGIYVVQLRSDQGIVHRKLMVTR